MTTTKITRAVARKVLETVDCGLSHGLGSPKPGEMCVEAAVCYALGLPHDDDPGCVASSVRAFKIGLNDQPWANKHARAVGLRRLAIAQLGSKRIVNDVEFAKRVAEAAIRKLLPPLLRSIGLVEHANACEAEGSEKAAYAAAYAAADAAAYAAADAAARAAARAAYAADAAARAAAYAAADAAARAAARAAYAADAAARAAAYAAAYAADAAADAADKVRSGFAEVVVQILVELKSPGCKYLDLTE